MTSWRWLAPTPGRISTARSARTSSHSRSGESRWTLVLAPNGRVEVLARVLCTAEDRFELDTEAGLRRRPGRPPQSLPHPRQGRARAVDGRPVRPPRRIGESSVQETVRSAHQSRVGWWDTGRWVEDSPPGAPAGTIDDYERARVAAGWPAMGTEIVPGERIPGEVAVVPRRRELHEGVLPRPRARRADGLPRSQAPRQLRVVSVADWRQARRPGRRPGRARRAPRSAS